MCTIKAAIHCSLHHSFQLLSVVEHYTLPQPFLIIKTHIMVCSSWYYLLWPDSIELSLDQSEFECFVKLQRERQCSVIVFLIFQLKNPFPFEF